VAAAGSEWREHTPARGHQHVEQKSFQERAHNVTNIQRSNVSVGLPDTHKNHGLACSVHHGYGSSHLIVDGVELGQNNTIDLSCSLFVHIMGSVLDESLIETSQLVHAVVPNEGFTDKQNLVGANRVDKFRKRLHEGLVILTKMLTLI
jgi:hypothetical protein